MYVLPVLGQQVRIALEFVGINRIAPMPLTRTLTKTLARTPTPLLIMRFARLEVEGLLRKLARTLGINRPQALTLDDLHIPDSSYTRAATALVGSIESPMLFNHSMRTYLFGAAIGCHLGLRADPELLYLAAILHDIGLVAPYDSEGSFEINGARAAHKLLVDEGMNPGSAELVHEAIVLHAAVGIANTREPEIALVHYGAGFDVIGFHAEDIALTTRDAVVGRYPRLQFKRDFTSLIADQSLRKPDCHIAGHVALGFERKIRAAPFAE